MKYFLFLVLLSGAARAVAQTDNNARIREFLSKYLQLHLLPQIPGPSLQAPYTNTILPQIPLQAPVVDIVKLSMRLPDGNKLYLLPQDGMPCVATDLTAGTMPVLKPVLEGFIPNPAKKLLLLPN